MAWVAGAAQVLRTTWRSLQPIIDRVVTDLVGKTDRLAGLRRIGIDEISYWKRRFLMLVIDHDSGRLVWAADGRNQTTVRAFFDSLGAEADFWHPHRPACSQISGASH